MPKIKKTAVLVKDDWVRFLVAGLSIALGFYIVFHENYLDTHLVHAVYVRWLDDMVTGLTIIFFGVLMLLSVFVSDRWFKKTMLISNAFVNGCIFYIFLLRDYDGSHNMTWIYALFVVFAIFGVALTGTGGKEREAS